jgi:hypothetical protein
VETRTGFLVGNPEVRRPLGRPRRKFEDNIKTDLKINSIGHTEKWQAVVKKVMNLRVP